MKTILARIHMAFGLACLIVPIWWPATFKISLYQAFNQPVWWGVLCVSLSLALYFVRGSRASIALNVVSAFLLLVIAGAISARDPNTGTFVYAVVAWSSFECVYLTARDMYVRRRMKGQADGQ